MLEDKLAEAGTFKKLLDGTLIFNMHLSPIVTRLFPFFWFFLSSSHKPSNGGQFLKAVGEAGLLNIVYEAMSELSYFPFVEWIIFFMRRYYCHVDSFPIYGFNA